MQGVKVQKIMDLLQAIMCKYEYLKPHRQLESGYGLQMITDV